MKRPILDRYAKSEIYSQETLEKWRENFDDDEILCYVLIEYFQQSTNFISVYLGDIDKLTIEDNHRKIKYFSLNISDNFDSKAIIDTIILHGCCSRDFIDILSEYFSEEAMICFILIEYLNYSPELVKYKLKKLTIDEVNANHLKVKKFVDEYDENEDELPQKFILNAGGSNSVNAYYNGSRFPKIYLPWDINENDPEEISPDWGYLEDIHNN